ncbi:MAG: hypothetical protein VB068_12460 [Petrimonas sp.]|nr:hypothetical protein [Petrimonas sp.]
MELFLYYLLRASVLMALFYGFYKLFLAGSTFHHINRILLIFIVLTVFLLPLFHFHLIPEKKRIRLPKRFWRIFLPFPSLNLWKRNRR